MSASSRPVKFYTRARRFPRLIGTTLGGRTIPGGPYTVRQLALGIVVLVVGTKTSTVWGASVGGISKVILVLTAAVAAVVLTRNLPTFTRNPLSLMAGVVRILTGPASGRRRNRPIRLPRINPVGGLGMIDGSPSSWAGPSGQPTAGLGSDDVEDLREELRWPGAMALGRQAAPGPPIPPAPATSPGLSRVSELLATAAAGSRRPPPEAIARSDDE